MAKNYKEINYFESRPDIVKILMILTYTWIFVGLSCCLITRQTCITEIATYGELTKIVVVRSNGTVNANLT